MKFVSSKKNLLWAGFFLALALASAAAAYSVLRIESDQKNAVIFGLSIQRIFLLAAVMIGLLSAVYGALRAALQPDWVDRWLQPVLGRVIGAGWSVVVCAALTLVGWLALFMPSYWFGPYHAYYTRLRPIIIWLGFCSAWSIVFVTIWLKGWRLDRSVLAGRDQRQWLRASAIVMALLAAIWLLIALTGLGVKADPYYWNEAGAPLLGLQLILSLLLVAVANRLVFSRDASERRRSADWGVVILIWLGAFLLWQFTSMPRSYFAPGPYPPDNIFYPYSDAERYDYSAQYLLLGRGIANGEYMDKPAYVFILAVLHLLAGQNYTILVALQVALLALAPVGLYLLGKSLHSRQVGLLVALMAVFQQRNAIAATLEIQVSTSRLLLTEYPTAMLLIFFCLFAVRWFQSPDQRPASLLLSAGLLGIAALIRPNALFLAPLLIILILFKRRREFKWKIATSGLFLAVFVLTILPWNLVIPKGFTTPYLIAKARSLFDSRYRLIEMDSSSNSTGPISSMEASKNFLKPEAPAELKQFAAQASEQETDSSYSFIWRHYLHNEIMAFFILPHSIQLQDLEHTLQTPYWQDIAAWNGELPAGTIMMMILNLGLLSLGIGAAWRRWRLAGLIPLIVQAGYYFANAVVRNSGSRYLVPADWVMLVYYGLGLIQLFIWLSRLLNAPTGYFLPEGQAAHSGDRTTQESPLRWQRCAVICAAFLLVGGLLPLSRYAFPDRLPDQTPADVIYELAQIDWQDDRMAAWLESWQAGNILVNPGAVVLTGRGLYPRYYDLNHIEGESNGELASYFLPAASEPRFTLRLLTRDAAYYAILPMPASPLELEHDARLAVIGCIYGDGTYIDTAAILVMEGHPEVLWRDSSVDLSCPLEMP